MTEGTILIVDDNETNGNMCRLYLESEGYTVYFAQDGKTGVEIAAEIIPDVVLLDLMMPVMNGYAFLEDFRSHPLLVDIPILVMTVMNDTFNAVNAFHAGANDYMKKPFDADEFIARIEKLVQSKKEKDLLRKQSENLSRQHHLLENKLKNWIQEAKIFQNQFDTLPLYFSGHPLSPDDVESVLNATRHATSLIKEVLTFGLSAP